VHHQLAKTGSDSDPRPSRQASSIVKTYYVIVRRHAVYTNQRAHLSNLITSAVTGFFSHHEAPSCGSHARRCHPCSWAGAAMATTGCLANMPINSRPGVNDHCCRSANIRPHFAVASGQFLHAVGSSGALFELFVLAYGFVTVLQRSGARCSFPASTPTGDARPGRPYRRCCNPWLPRRSIAGFGCLRAVAVTFGPSFDVMPRVLWLGAVCGAKDAART